MILLNLFIQKHGFYSGHCADNGTSGTFNNIKISSPSTITYTFCDLFLYKLIWIKMEKMCVFCQNTHLSVQTSLWKNTEDIMQVAFLVNCQKCLVGGVVTGEMNSWPLYFWNETKGISFTSHYIGVEAETSETDFKTQTNKTETVCVDR